MKSWELRLQEQVNRDWKSYKVYRLDLAAGRNNQRHSFPGDFLAVESASSLNALATIKLNRTAAENINLQYGTFIETVFIELYISNTAQPGEWIDVIVGIDCKKQTQARRRTAQAVIELTHANANTDVAPAAGPTDRVVITADPTNTNIAWIDFSQAAVQDGCYPLEPGDSITVQVSTLSDIHANFEFGGEKVWIINEI